MTEELMKLQAEELAKNTLKDVFNMIPYAFIIITIAVYIIFVLYIKYRETKLKRFFDFILGEKTLITEPIAETKETKNIEYIQESLDLGLPEIENIGSKVDKNKEEPSAFSKYMFVLVSAWFILTILAM